MASNLPPLPPGFTLDAGVPPPPPGFQVDQRAPTQVSNWDTAVDVAKAIPSGIARGAAALAGLPGDLNQLVSRGVGKLRDKVIGDLTPEERANLDAQKEAARISPTTAEITDKASEVTGVTLPEPQTRAGKFAHTVGEFIPGALSGPGGLARKAITNAVVPGLASEGAGQLTEGTALEPYARFGGAIVGGITGSRLVTPIPTSPERQALAATLQNEGVHVTAGQATGNQKLRYMESEIGGPRGAQVMENQGEEFTRAVLRRAGENADRATPEVIDRAFTRIGSEFDDLAARNTLGADRQFANDISVVQQEYHTIANPLQRRVLDDVVDGVIDTMSRGNGMLTGAQYQAIRSRLDKAARGSRFSDNQLSDALFGVRNALDEAMERSISASNPADLAAWQEARRQYKNLLVIERAATGAGENAAQGIISPSQLRSATVGQNRRAYARGQGDFADLARAGEGLMKPLPNSGTPGRTAARNLFAAVPTAIGATAGGQMGGMDSALVGALLGSAVPALAGRTLMSRPVQAYLGNQMLPAFTPGDLSRQSMVRALNASIAAREPARRRP